MANTAFLEPPAVEQPSGFRRIQPETVTQFADEFSNLLRDVQDKRVGAEASLRLNALVDTFEELVREMRAASKDIRKLLAE